jgi:hypothetical protein
MFKQLLPGAIAAVVLFSMPLGAKDAPAPAPTAPPELAQLTYFEGNWSCTGKAFANPMSPEHATAATVHSSNAVGGRWLHITYDETKTTANPMPYHVGVYMGFDAAKKTFVDTCADNFGGYCLETSSGWKGDTMIFEGMSNADGKQFAGRDTFTKKSATEFTHAGDMQSEDKKWMRTDEETCRKGK